MSTTPDSTLDPQQLIAELQRQLAESNAERDEAQQQLIERTAEYPLGVLRADHRLNSDPSSGAP
jgi:hypothetical protein